MLSLNRHHNCCAAGSTFSRCSRSFAEWLLPGAFLLLIPKCPLCIVAYAAAAGLGISVSTAAGLRFTLLLVCLFSIIFVALKSIRRFLAPPTL